MEGRQGLLQTTLGGCERLWKAVPLSDLGKGTPVWAPQFVAPLWPSSSCIISPPPAAPCWVGNLQGKATYPSGTCTPPLVPPWVSTSPEFLAQMRCASSQG